MSKEPPRFEDYISRPAKSHRMHKDQWRSVYFWQHEPPEPPATLLIPPTEAFLVSAIEGDTDLVKTDGIEVSLTMMGDGKEYLRFALSTILGEPPYRLYLPLLLPANSVWKVQLDFANPRPCEVQIHLLGTAAIQRPGIDPT